MKKVTIISEDPNPNDTADPATMLLSCIIRGGSVPFSPAQNCEIPKQKTSTMPAMRVPSTRVEARGEPLLPHCSARSTSTSPGTSNAVPIGSYALSLCPSVFPAWLCAAGLSGTSSSNTPSATPPTGTLIQKHQRHETLVANTPPSSGPAIDASPKVAPMKPWYFGRLDSGTRSARMTFAPVMLPALPRPARARPRMKGGEEGAAAQRMEPSSKRRMRVMKVGFAGKKV